MAKSIIGLIGGSGLGEAMGHEVSGEVHEIETPFGRPSGAIVRANWEGVEVAFLPRHGPGHTLCPSAVPYRANIYALKSLGVTHIIASGAVGSLREEIRPRDLVVADQVIDKTSRRASTFFDVPGLAVHVEAAEPFCGALRHVLIEAARGLDFTVHDGGTYVCMEGPAFSTIAESRMHRAWGGDLIGMTCMPEAKLAREAEISYALIALPTDYDCWRPHDPSMDRKALIQEIVHNLKDATERSIRLIRAALAHMAGNGAPASQNHDALTLAIWTNRDHLTPEVIARYGPLLQRYAP